MDPMLLLVFVVGGLVLFGIVVLMLNRAWGDFPSKVSTPPSDPLRPSTQSSAPTQEWAQSHAAAEPELPAGAPSDGLIQVKHPLVHRTIAQALERGGSPYATYFMRDGETIYLNLDRIATRRSGCGSRRPS